MSAAGDPDRSRSGIPQAQLAPLADARFRDLHVEFDVADHVGSSAIRTEGDEALRILRALCRDQGVGRHRGAEERPETAVSRDRSWRQARIREHHGYAPPPALLQQVGPQFGLHDDGHSRPDSRQESAYRSRRIVGQEAHVDVVAEQRQRARPARRRRGGQHEGHRGMARAQLTNQRRRSAHFAQGHRMQPDARRVTGRRTPSEALARIRPIASIAQAAPEHDRKRRRGQQDHQRAVNASQEQWPQGQWPNGP